MATFSVLRQFFDNGFDLGVIEVFVIRHDVIGVQIFNLKEEGRQTHMRITCPVENDLYLTITSILETLTSHIGHTGIDGVVFTHRDIIWEMLDKRQYSFNRETVKLLGYMCDIDAPYVNGHVDLNYDFVYEGGPWSSEL